jgi:hypothetical protein
MTIAIITATVCIVILGIMEVRGRIKQTNAIISVIEDEFDDLKEELKEAEELACVHPECKRRKTGSEYLNVRLLHVGYQQYLRQEENDERVIEKAREEEVAEANKEAAESVKDGGDRVYMSEIATFPLSEKVGELAEAIKTAGGEISVCSTDPQDGGNDETS